MTRFQDLFDVSSSQRGLICRDDLRRLDIDRHELNRLVTRGVLRRIGRRTFEVGGTGADPLRPLLAACLDTGGALSHRSSSLLLDLAPLKQPRLPDVVVARERGSIRSPLATVHSTTNLTPDDLVVVQGIPCVSVARTLLTIAALTPEIDPEDVRNVVDDAVRRGKATDRWLWVRLEKLRCHGRAGVSVLEAILTARAGGQITESWLERQFLRVLRDAGVPLPRCQARIEADRAFVARVDFAYDNTDLVIEVTGAVAHATARQRAADAARRNRLANAGKLVLEFTYEQVVGDPVGVVTAVREALARQVPPIRRVS